MLDVCQVPGYLLIYFRQKTKSGIATLTEAVTSLQFSCSSPQPIHLLYWLKLSGHTIDITSLEMFGSSIVVWIYDIFKVVIFYLILLPNKNLFHMSRNKNSDNCQEYLWQLHIQEKIYKNNLWCVQRHKSCSVRWTYVKIPSITWCCTAFLFL